MDAPAQVPALTASEQAGLTALLEQLQQRYPEQVVQVILFGSHARQQAGPESDVDLLVLVEQESWPLRYDIWTLAGRIELVHNLLFNIQVIAWSRWQAMSRAGFSFCRNVQREGIVLWERTSAKTPSGEIVTKRPVTAGA